MDPNENDVPTHRVERAREGDLSAYGRLVESTEGAVRAAVSRVIRDPHLAEDAVQECYLRAFRRLPGLRDPAAFVGWLLRVARTTALNVIRARRRSFVDAIEVSELPAPAGPPDPFPDDVRRGLARAMVTLAPEDRRLCERYYHGGWAAARIAAEFGLTPAAVRKRLERIRRRLRKEIEMTASTEGGEGAGDLPAKIIELLSKPLLTDLPENPVGDTWEAVKAGHDDHEEIAIPETLTREEIESVIGAEGMVHLPDMIHHVDEKRMLRWDTSIPMLLAARGRPAGEKLMAAGKVYRNEGVDSRHLQVFHQAEMMFVGEDVREWDMMPRITRWVESLLGGRRLRLVQVDYPIMCDRAWEVAVDWDGDWLDILGWGTIRPDVVRALGHDPERVKAVGVGFGLERIACLRHGIDDVRKVESTKL